MKKETRNFSIVIPIDMIDALENLAEKLNKEAGLTGKRGFSRNWLISKAIEDYYFREIDIFEERRRKNLHVENDKRNKKDRRKKRPMTCSYFHSNINALEF